MSAHESQTGQDEVPCCFCGEMVGTMAWVCKHCHKELPRPRAKTLPSALEASVDRLIDAEAANSSVWGDVSGLLPNPAMLCPHCGQVGGVSTKRVRKDAGISGAKATSYLLFGAVSLWLAGLTRRENVTEAHCSHCHNTWQF